MARFVDLAAHRSSCCATEVAYRSRLPVRLAAPIPMCCRQRCRVHAAAQSPRSRSCIGPAHRARRRTRDTDRVCGSRRKGAAADNRRRAHYWNYNGVLARELRCTGVLVRTNRDDGTAYPYLRDEKCGRIRSADVDSRTAGIMVHAAGFGDDADVTVRGATRR